MSSLKYVSENVFKSKSIRTNPVRRKDRRQHFTEDELRHIFNHKTYLTVIFDNPTGRKQTYITHIIGSQLFGSDPPELTP